MLLGNHSVLARHPGRDIGGGAIGLGMGRGDYNKSSMARGVFNAVSGYTATVRTDGVVAYWRLGESSGTNADDEITTLDGVYTNTPSLGVAGVLAGDVNTAVTFTQASSEYVTVTDHATLDQGDGPLSWECWYKLTDLNLSDSTLLSKGTNAPILQIGVNGSVLEMGWYARGVGFGCTGSIPQDTNWHHVVGTKSAADVWTLYIDGADVTTGASTASTASTATAFEMGRDAASSDTYLNGSLDEVALYNAVLTPAQVLAHFQMGDTGSGWESKSGRPDGYRPPYTWVIPQTAGGLASRNILAGTGSLAASGAAGLNATAALTGTGDLTASGALIVQAIAALSGAGTLTASAEAILQAVAALTGSGDLTASTTALGYAVAALTGTGTLTAPPYAIGSLEADISPFTDLSPENLAASVWNALAADFNTAGSMGNKVNSAASAGDPWGTALPGAYGAGEAGQILGTIGEVLLDEENIESGLTVREALRLISAALAGKLSGAAGPTVVIRDVNDTKDRITATVDADGNRTSVTTDPS